VELLVVVAIIALLVTILMPALGRALDLARKAVCAGQMNVYGRGSLMYVKEHNSYPPMGDNRFQPWGWPKFYGVMQAMGLRARRKEQGIWDFSEWELDECWEKAFCPAMDYVTIIKRADKALPSNAHPLMKVALHRVAAGYQWNVTLRAAGRAMPPTCESGRWSTACWPPDLGWPAWDNTGWLGFPIFLVRQSRWYICQAVVPDELPDPAHVAEAWDGMDYETLPHLTWPNGTWSREGLCPGWHVGPQSEGTRGWAVLNGARHPSSPNILYADGHVGADATRQLSPSQMGPMPNGGSWKDMKLNSWEDFLDTWGTMHHIVPERRFTRTLE
jgi:prepilin-type processing-associated H-X9-DG protein